MIKIVNQESKLVAYIRKHKNVRGIDKSIVDFYVEYKLERENRK